ncbi:MAG: hypothetical protein EBZ50_13175, partial [Alphaproteobacteria bacterium]|nr:hypothetical protein [Alphaproteobacteria bacterium]
LQSLSDLKAGAAYRISYAGSADAKLIWNGAEAVVARVGDRYEASVSASATTATIGFTSAADLRIDDVKVTAIGALEMSVAEGASGGAVVGKLNVIDSDAGERFTYSLSDNADGRFGINSVGQIIVLDGSRIDFETAKVHSITVRVLDSGGAEAVQTFAVAVSNVTGQVVGGTAADTLDGTSEEDFVLGLAGDDRLTGRAGADRLVGGAGTDTADYATSTAGVDVDLTRTGAQSGGFAQGDILSGVENVTGSIGDDILTGDAGVNVLRGAGGDDRFDGGGGADTLDGGGGDDIYLINNSGVTIVEVDGGGSDEVRTTLGAYTLTNWVEKLTYTGPGAFRGVGNALDNILKGGAGADTLIGLAGADKLDGGAGVDTADYSDSAAGVIVNVANGQASGGDAEGDTLVAIENVIGAANAANRLTGSAGVNVLTGGSMADELDAGGAGGAGDTLRGGKGDDLYYVSNATDVVVEAANEGVDSVRSRIAAFTLADNVENLKYIGAAATLTLTGNARANRIEAGDGAGALYGLGGD